MLLKKNLKGENVEEKAFKALRREENLSEENSGKRGI